MKQIFFKYPLLFIFIIFIIVELFIRPRVQLPLNDDWAYNKVIKHFLQTGEINLPDWIAVPFFAQFLLGLLVSKIFGFSFLITRILTIGITFGIISTFYFSLKHYKMPTILNVLVVLLFTFNPLTLYNANTFLPDIYVLFFSFFSFYFCLKYFQNSDTRSYVIFIFFSVLAILTRQTGILIPFAFGLVYFFLNQKISFIRKSIISFLPFFTCFLVLYLYKVFLIKYSILPSNFNLHLKSFCERMIDNPFWSLKNITINLFNTIVALGIFMLPIISIKLKFFIRLILTNKLYSIQGIIIFCLLIFKVAFLSDNHFPFRGNIFYPNGIGPIILTDYNTDLFEVKNLFQKILFSLITIIGVFSFILFIVDIIESVKTKNNIQINYIVSIIMLMYIGIISLNYANDRYLLFLIPFMLFLFIMNNRNIILNLTFFYILFIPLSIYSVVAIRDYFIINEAKYKAFHYLKNEKNISTRKIDAGFEISGYYNEGICKYKAIGNHFWWICDDQYMITPIKQKGYQVIKSFSVDTYFSFNYNKLLVLKRDE